MNDSCKSSPGQLLILIDGVVNFPHNIIEVLISLLTNILDTQDVSDFQDIIASAEDEVVLLGRLLELHFSWTSLPKRGAFLHHFGSSGIFCSREDGAFGSWLGPVNCAVLVSSMASTSAFGS